MVVGTYGATDMNLDDAELGYIKGGRLSVILWTYVFSLGRSTYEQKTSLTFQLQLGEHERTYSRSVIYPLHNCLLKGS